MRGEAAPLQGDESGGGERGRGREQPRPAGGRGGGPRERGRGGEEAEVGGHG